MGNRSKARRGVTLMEILLALVLLSFGLFGVVDLYMNQSRLVVRSQRQVRAASLAQSYLAQLQAAGYGALDEKLRTHADAASPDRSWLFPSPTGSTLDGDFEWNAHLRRIETDGRKRIEARVVVERGAPASGRAGQDSAHSSTPTGGVRKEVTGHVFAP